MDQRTTAAIELLAAHRVGAVWVLAAAPARQPNVRYGPRSKIDRYYIENFLIRHALDIHGCVLEIASSDYTTRFGDGRVIKSEVLHVEEGNPRATIVDDLASGNQIASDSFDSIILTETLQFIFAVHL